MSLGLPFTLSLIIPLLLLLLATCERERIGARSQGGQRVIGQLDPVCQGRRKEHQCLLCGNAIGDDRSDADRRSEEHTSELQSQSNLVCRLLLEKKNSGNLIDTNISSSGLIT